MHGAFYLTRAARALQVAHAPPRARARALRERPPPRCTPRLYLQYPPCSSVLYMYVLYYQRVRSLDTPYVLSSSSRDIRPSPPSALPFAT